jgi:hypothetical protein
MSGLYNANDIVWTPRDYQMAFVYTVLAIVAAYYAGTEIIPQLIRTYTSWVEKKQVLQNIKVKVSQEDPTGATLISSRESEPHPKQVTVKKNPVKPNFHLKSTSSTNSILSTKILEESKERLSKSDSVIPVVQENLKSTANAAGSRASQQKTNKPISAPQSEILGGFASNSIEAQLHATLAQENALRNSDHVYGRFDADAAIAHALNLQHERELRELQDAEYIRSIEDDTREQVFSQ